MCIRDRYTFRHYGLSFDSVNSLSSLPVISLYNTSASAVREPRNAGEPEASGKDVGGLDAAELKELTDLKARDRDVRAHEAAHQAAGGQHAGAMSFTYQRGPDGAQYAVGGEVSINMSPVDGNPPGNHRKNACSSC